MAPSYNFWAQSAIRFYLVVFHICNALKIRLFQALLHSIPFGSWGEAGARGQGCQILFPVLGGKNPDGQGAKSGDFSRPLRKNAARPLTVWIGGTDIERDCFQLGDVLYLKQ